MKDRMPGKDWYPFWIDKWLFGSMRLEFNAEERGIWIDLYTFSSKDKGYIRANKETPYLIEQLSGMLNIPEKNLESAIEGFIKKKKIRRYKTGILKIIKWEKYQFTDRYKRKIKETERKAIEQQFKNEFDELWLVYPEKKSKQDAFNAFKTLRRSGVSLQTIRRAYNGYMDFLKRKWKKENFEQSPMYLGTFLRKNRWKDYIDEKYTNAL